MYSCRTGTRDSDTNSTSTESGFSVQVYTSTPNTSLWMSYTGGMRSSLSATEV